MKRKLMLFLLAAIIIPLATANGSPVEFSKGGAARISASGDLDISVRLVGGKGAVFRPGRDINLTFQTSKDAYVVIYNIDSEGYVNLLFPADGKLKRVNGRKVYFLPEQGSGIYWETGDKTGVEYIHAVAVSNGDQIALDELYFLAQSRKKSDDERFKIDMDPFLAFNMIDEEIALDAENNPPSTDFTYFYINRKVDYPRYLCDSCHGKGKISDPYAMECPEIIIEKMTYEEDLSYPYPSLFEITHVDEDGSYMSTDYTDNLGGDLDYYDDDDTKVYLSIYYSNYDYPYRFDYPGYRYWYIGYYDPWYWDYDPWFWGFGTSWHWAGSYYHYWPFGGWHRYDYNRYHWAHWNGYWNGYYDWHNNDYYRRAHRDLYATRQFTKRGLSYAALNNKLHHDKVISNSLLVKTRKSNPVAGNYERSSLSRRASAARTVQYPALTKTTRDPSIKRNVTRNVIYGGGARAVQNRSVDGQRTSRRVYTPAKVRERENRTTRTGDGSNNERKSGTSGTTVRERTNVRKKSADRSGNGRSSNSQGKTTTRKDTGRSTSKGKSSGSKSTSSTGKSTRSRNKGPVSTPTRTRSSSSRSTSRSTPARSSSSKSSSRSGSSRSSSKGKKR